jgi:hypothetical protein
MIKSDSNHIYTRKLLRDMSTMVHVAAKTMKHYENCFGNILRLMSVSAEFEKFFVVLNFKINPLLLEEFRLSLRIALTVLLLCE